MKRARRSGALAVGLALAVGAGMAAAPTAAPLRATAALTDTAGQVVGRASFSQQGAGVQVQLSVQGLTPGRHGLHIHEFGRCTPGVDAATNSTVAFGGAGGHFDPEMTGNHATPQTDDKHGHAGDLPMLSVGADGSGTASFTSDKISLVGAHGILGRSVVVHAQPDDYQSDPAGLTGARERCGVIVRDALATRDYPLPGAQDFPEGVAYDAKRGLLFTGSAATGDIYAINAQTGATSLFSRGGAVTRRSALGLKVDPEGRLWVAGGATGAVSLLSRDGAPLATWMTPQSPDPYLNDLTLAPDGAVYVTDSSRPVLWRVRGQHIEPWLDLTRTPIRTQPGINLNGIVVTPDGRSLLSVQLNTGVLWRIDLRTKAVQRVLGGLTNGDGLLLDGHTLYVNRNADELVTKVQLSPDYRRGRVVAEEPAGGLRYPSTLAMIGGDLVSTQSQLNKLQGGTPETPFRLTRFKKF